MNVSDNEYLRRADGRRYLAIEGSNTAHCCFAASVIDLSDPQMVNGSKVRVNFYPTVCECFDLADAENIAELLNASGTLTEGGDAKQAPGDSLSGPVAKPDAQP